MKKFSYEIFLKKVSASIRVKMKEICKKKILGGEGGGFWAVLMFGGSLRHWMYIVQYYYANEPKLFSNKLLISQCILRLFFFSCFKTFLKNSEDKSIDWVVERVVEFTIPHV